jgi:hypothetical protein
VMRHSSALDGIQSDGLASDLGSEISRRFAVGGEQEYGRSRDHA